MGRFATRLFSALIALALIVGGAFGWGYTAFVRPGPLVTPVTVVIPAGSGVEAIATQLAHLGVLADPLVFRLGVRMRRAGKTLRAGEYAFPARISPREAIALLQSGKTVVRRLTVAEGLTTRQVLDRLAVTDGLVGSLDGVLAEGTLLPETYHFSHGDKRSAIVERMKAAMGRALSTLWQTRAPGLPLKKPMDALILASIVEKETGRPEERARVASVFINRLRKGMRLQSDPTVVYGLTGGRGALGRRLLRQDLKSPSPFNTYTNDGLPPSPICNPGQAALAAVLRPAETKDLYFVADGTGGHVFARSLNEHNNNVARWRKIRKQQATEN
jgi:UPF0755 protein